MKKFWLIQLVAAVGLVFVASDIFPSGSVESTGFRRVKGIHADVSGMVDSFVQAYNAANAKHK